MRLLIVTPEFAPHSGGGILRYYGNLTPALARAGVDVTVLVAAPFADDFADYDAAGGVRVTCVKQAATAEADGALSQFSAAPDFRRWLAAGWAARRAVASLGAFDAIETTDFGLGFVPFLVEPTGVPLVVRCHGSLGQISQHEPRQPAFELDLALARLAESSMLPLSDDLQTYADGNAGEWADRLGREVAVVRPAVEVSDRQNPTDGYAVVVGRVQSWKGPEVLCQALQLLPASACPRVLWIGRDTRSAVDGGSLDADLRRRFPDVWGERVQPQGSCSFAEAQALMARARFVIVPSVWDVFNFTAVEAMAAGKVVVCSTGAGAHELITPEESGLLAGAGKARALADAIGKAASLSAPEVARLGEAARETVRTVLAPDVVARAHLERYGGLGSSNERCNEWTRTFFEPSASTRVGLDYLDQVGIRRLGAYLSARLRRRVTSAGPGGAAS